MTRLLRAVGGSALVPAVRDALSGSGDAVFAGEAIDLPESVPQKVALVVQSSGSTGSPKRVMLSADALLASAAASETALGAPGQWMLALPATYIAGINVVVRALSSGFELVEVAPGSFTPDLFVEADSRMTERRRFVSLVPTQLSRILESVEATRRLAQYAGVLVGGQAVRAELHARALEAGIHVVRTYGSSETSGGCVYDGAPIGATRVRVVDGEVELSTPSLAEGYLGDPARTDAAFHWDAGARWYRTGDAGSFVDSTLSISGRLDDVIISGGIKVSLAEIEAVVRSLDTLGEAVVVRADDAEWGEVPVVIGVGPIDLALVRAVVASALGNAAAPASARVVQSIPVLPSGKPDRRALERLLAE